MSDTSLDRALGLPYRILRLLLEDPEKRWYLEEITKELPFPKMTIHRHIKKMGLERIMISEKKKYRRYWRLNDSHTVKALKILTNIDCDLVHELVEHYQGSILILYGSRARGTSGPGSDWDFLIIDDDLGPLEINEFVNHIETKYDVRVDVKRYSKEEFRRMRSEKTPFYMDIISGMYVLRGDPNGL